MFTNLMSGIDSDGAPLTQFQDPAPWREESQDQYFQQKTNSHADGHLEEGTVHLDSVNLEASMEQNEHRLLYCWHKANDYGSLKLRQRSSRHQVGEYAVWQSNSGTRGFNPSLAASQAHASGFEVHVRPIGLRH